MNIKQKANEVNFILSTKYPNPLSALEWKTPWQMLVAAILSAQTTDIMVNKVTKDLFLLYPDAESTMNSSLSELEIIIRRVNYYKNKSKYILENAKVIHNEYMDKVPNSLEDLIKLKGIGRKVANVIIGDVFHAPVGIVVDTHVKRVSNRIGLTDNVNPIKIELDLMKLLPKSQWVNISHRLIFHGREVCIARKPKCEICIIKEYCRYFKYLKT